MAFYKEGAVGDIKFAESVMHSIKVIADNTTIIANACNTEKEEEKIKTEDIPEFVGEIIDIFEDFLDDKNVKIPKSEEDKRLAMENDVEDIDFIKIYGSDYDNLSSKLNMLLKMWNIVK